ncbi:hypothetical protein LCGC14_0952200 [marine sediment metagenome]|uniref:VWFA domain-containing protein n=1 Tax=marine sediment metagenome TaxID=412755 RepID=A0A0F9R0F1_9ZZZZ
MLPRSEAVNSEEFIFYIDLISDFLKKKPLMKSISAFIKEKKKFKTLASYGVVIFQRNENPVNLYDLKDAESVSKVINNSWDSKENQQSYLENGLYEILAYIFRKSRTTRKNYRVIIISDTPSKLSEDYYNALYDLLIKAKKFSTFIDIIRVGDEKFYEDDVKLKIISSETHGGTFYCPNEKLLQNILGSLIQNKNEFKVIKMHDSEQILEEDKVFYERLAVDLISLSSEDQERCTICEQELCPICEAHSDEIHKCFNCNAKFHGCCSAKYSIAKNIGFNHIFRCPQCETLLKLDEEFVKMIYQEDLGEELPEVDINKTFLEEPVEEEPKHEEFLEETETQQEIVENTEEIPEIDSKPPLHPPPSPTIAKKVKVGGFFGKEITITTKNVKKEKTSETHEIKEEPKKKKPASITTLKPPRKRRSSTIKLCKICGTTCGAKAVCGACGAKVD